MSKFLMLILFTLSVQGSIYDWELKDLTAEKCYQLAATLSDLATVKCIPK